MIESGEGKGSRDKNKIIKIGDWGRGKEVHVAKAYKTPFYYQNLILKY